MKCCGRNDGFMGKGGIMRQIQCRRAVKVVGRGGKVR